MYKSIIDNIVAEQVILLRVDLNLPMHAGKVLDDTRARKIKPTVDFLLQNGAKKVIIMSHLGRPRGIDSTFSLQQILPCLQQILGQDIVFVEDYLNAKNINAPLILLENLRFHNGEEANEPSFAEQLASLGDVYVNDAFAVSHRAHASVEAITRFVPSFAGLLLQEELQFLEGLMKTVERPYMAIVGGKKVSDKIPVLTNLVAKVDYLCIMGAMANTFLLALGKEIGASLVEQTQVEFAKKFLVEHEKKIILPQDFAVSRKEVTHIVEEMLPGDIAFDVGPKTAMHIANIVSECKSLVWNGPVGMYEHPSYRNSSEFIARIIASNNHSLTSIAGGGDVVAAIETIGLSEQFTFISTAGGAFLEWLEGKQLPGVEALRMAV